MVPVSKPVIYVVTSINTQGQYVTAKSFSDEDAARNYVKWLKMQPAIAFAYFTKTELN